MGYFGLGVGVFLRQLTPLHCTKQRANFDFGQLSPLPWANHYLKHPAFSPQLITNVISSSCHAIYPKSSSEEAEGCSTAEVRAWGTQGPELCSPAHGHSKFCFSSFKLVLSLQVGSLPSVECCEDELVKAGAVPETVKCYRFAVRKERYKLHKFQK